MDKHVCTPVIQVHPPGMNLANQNLFKAVDISPKYFYFPRKPESYMTNSNLAENDFKI